QDSVVVGVAEDLDLDLGAVRQGGDEAREPRARLDGLGRPPSADLGPERVDVVADLEAEIGGRPLGPDLRSPQPRRARVVLALDFHAEALVDRALVAIPGRELDSLGRARALDLQLGVVPRREPGARGAVFVLVDDLLARDRDDAVAGLEPGLGRGAA